MELSLTQLGWWLPTSSDKVCPQVLLGELVAGQHVEGVSIDLHIATHWHVSWSQSLSLLVNILVLSALEEFTWDDAGVLLGGLIDGDAVVREVERDDESPVDVLWHSRVKPRSESQNVLVVVNSLEEVNLWLLWDETVHLSEGINLISKSIVGRLLHLDLFGDVWFSDAAYWELVAILLGIPAGSEVVDSLDHIDSAIGIDVTLRGDLVSSHIVVSNELLSWLVHIESIWKLLSSQEKWEGVTSIVGVVDLTNLHSVIGQVVVNHILAAI